MKTIGVLGGMGPDATALFFKKVVELTPASCDQEHIPIVIYNNPQIPDRTKSIISNGENPVNALKQSLALLERMAPDFICIPCNTVFYYFNEMQESTRTPIIHLIDSVLESAMHIRPSIKKVGLLATVGTIESRIYHDAFRKHGVDVTAPNATQYDTLHHIIRGLKDSSKDVMEIQSLGNLLVKDGAEGIVLGCTEFSLIANKLSFDVPLFDSIEILAKKAVKFAFD